MNWRRSIFSRKQADTSSQEEKETPASQDNQKVVGISADNPITKIDEDALGRVEPASLFTNQLLALDPSEGVVVGVLGDWGSGKTSFINLSRVFLEKSGITVLDFNPWMFSGADQLIQLFFIELAAQMKLRPGLSDIGKLVEDYGDTFSGLGWLPIIGPWIEGVRGATYIFAKFLKRKEKGIIASQVNLRGALKELDKPIVVVLDDIDRLSTSEIRDVFKLVRLTANFPNIIYLLAFDRFRVERALGEQDIPGRDYLEKILQIGFDLPALPSHIFDSQIRKAIEAALEDIDNPGHFNSEVWPDVFMDVIRPLIRNMRDVRRYTIAIYGTVRDLDGQVALVDVLALEAIRVFLPDVFHGLHSSVEGLTAAKKGHGYQHESEQLKKQIENLVSSVGERAEYVRRLISHLFPDADSHLDGLHYEGGWRNVWLKEKRVANEHILRYYLERVEGDQLQAFSYAENAWQRITDKTAFDGYLRSLPIEMLQDVISSLVVYEDEFGAEHVVPATIVLLNLLPLLPDRELGMFDLDAGAVVRRVVYRLVSSLKEPDVVEIAVKKILPEIQSLSSKDQLILMVGYREDAGHKLVSEETAKTLEVGLRAELRAATPQQLADETGLLWMLLRAKQESGPEEPEIVIPDNPAVTYALLKSARSETLSSTIGSRAVRRNPQLAWDDLVELYGSEDTLRDRIEYLKATPPDGIGDLIELADRYLAGWRPNDFGDD